MEGQCLAKKQKKTEYVWWLDTEKKENKDMDAVLLAALSRGEDMSTRYVDAYGDCVSAMSLSIHLDSPEVCEALLRNGVDPNGPCFYTKHDPIDCRPLELAFGNLSRMCDCVPVLLRYGADPDLVDLSLAYDSELSLFDSFRQYQDSICATLWVLRNIPGNIWVDMAEPVMDRMKKLDF
jgi:hypothetical protein